jgi:hexosaminidase
MSRHAAIAALALALAALPATGAEPPVVPIPASMKARAGSLALTNATALLVEPGDVGAQRAAANFADLVARTHGLRLRVRHDKAQGAISFRRVRGGPPEGYRIEIDARGARLSASTEAGFSHATATLWQLLPKKGRPVALPAVEIEDAPRFAWRGVMLDSARHFQSPEFIRRFIDWMALHKLNVLHWHLTDDQAWRLEIVKYPRLAQVGGWRVPAGAAAAQDLDPATGRPRMYGGYYSQATVRALVSYAAERGITIVPEIEMPGHATAAIVAYPQLAASAHPPTAVPADWGHLPQRLQRRRRDLRVPRGRAARGDGALPEPLHPRGRRRGREVAVARVAGGARAHARAGHRRSREAAGVLHPAHRALPASQRPAPRRLGRDPRAGTARGRRGDVVARHGRGDGGGQARVRHRARRAPDALLRQRAGALRARAPGARSRHHAA